MTPYSSKLFTLVLLCASGPLVLRGERFDRGSGQLKRELVYLTMNNYDVSLYQRIGCTFHINMRFSIVKCLHGLTTYLV